MTTTTAAHDFMSTTITMSQTQVSLSCCPSCGTNLPDPSSLAADAQQQIEDLQVQVRLLTQKATAAVDKWADYEDEIQTLRDQLEPNNSLKTPRPDSFISSVPFDERSSSPNRNSASNLSNRLSSFLGARKSTSNLKSPTPSSPLEKDLVEALAREQNLRQLADRKLDEASGELEELSAQLFMQANEMVATERRARAKLEERIEVLERRDGEKRMRLERLEGAVKRIDRVRGLLAPERASI